MRNTCPLSDQSCIPCPIRLPSCIGLPDGLNPISGNFWSLKYLRCFLNRTIDILKCPDGYFNPYLRTCVDRISPSESLDSNIQNSLCVYMIILKARLIEVCILKNCFYCAISAYVSEFCKTNPMAVVGSSINCAQYIDCTQNPESNVMECRYPDLFSAKNRKCQAFTDVECGRVIEPQAPCKIKLKNIMSILKQLYSYFIIKVMYLFRTKSTVFTLMNSRGTIKKFCKIFQKGIESNLEI